MILDTEDGRYFGLNPVGARIWTLLAEPIEVREIRAVMLDEFEVDAETCERDLLSLLDDLSRRNLIELVPPDRASSLPSSSRSTKLPTSDR